MSGIPRSAKEQIVLAAEGLLADRGIDGVSLRHIGAAAGSGNNSAVQYHFGSKDELIRAIFEYRLPQLHERRRLLIARQCPDDLRSWVECYVLPILEQGEQEGSNYLSFVAMLQQHGRRDVFDQLAEHYQESTRTFREQVAALLPQLVEPLRAHRIAQAMAFSVHAAAERERARAGGRRVLPFNLYVNDLIDGLVGFLAAPVSPAAVAALESTDPASFSWPLLL